MRSLPRHSQIAGAFFSRQRSHCLRNSRSQSDHLCFHCFGRSSRRSRPPPFDSVSSAHATSILEESKTPIFLPGLSHDTALIFPSTGRYACGTHPSFSNRTSPLVSSAFISIPSSCPFFPRCRWRVLAHHHLPHPSTIPTSCFVSFPLGRLAPFLLQHTPSPRPCCDRLRSGRCQVGRVGTIQGCTRYH